MQIKTGANLVVASEKNRSAIRRILIVGIGNILLKDEGIGVHVVGQLQKQDLPGNVEVIDGGTAGLDILLSQKEPYKLVVIDAIRAGGEPGTIYKTRLNAWHPQAQLGDGLKTAIAKTFGFDAATRTRQSQMSLHQVGLFDALRVAEKIKCAPEEVMVIGVEPSEISPGLELTTQVRQSVPRVVKEVLKEIEDVVHRE